MLSVGQYSISSLSFLIKHETRVLRKGPNWLRNGPRDVLLAEALFEVLKLLKLVEKVDARMDY